MNTSRLDTHPTPDTADLRDPAREQRVAELRDQIHRGEYVIDCKGVAEALLAREVWRGLLTATCADRQVA